MDRSRVERTAYRALADSGQSDPSFNPTAVATHFGATVLESPAEDSESGFCLRDGNRIVIGVNSNHSPNRQRFTIAHEVGHLLLHEGRALTVDKVVRISYRNEVSSMATDLQEIQANSFAAALLMPEIHVRATVSPLVSSGMSEDAIAAKLAKTFDVSPQAMSYRLLNLGIFLG
ncbi:ImmA/IrrE family metallo-endopeptidase [Pseudonocardia sp. N23]|uniref:ImmA/IrrE family metallo-endopeptidase n=1 Tax=Pseudonocardia sp. N23 TaxID=1987376 RepID=UPI000BFB5C99|nr:ImmA/IrrE family metallo-endopeptidase [Pseudonocardia sp. N23]